MHVVGNEHERSLVAFERHGQGLDGGDVEVGGGLVHQQEVGRVDEELDQVEAALFAAAEHLGQLVDLLLAEHEAAEDGARLVLAQVGSAGQDLVEDGLLGVEGIGAVLAEVAELGVVPDLALALLELEHAGHDLEQGGFAGAVGTHEHRPLAAFDGHVEAGIDLEGTVGHVDALEGDGALAAARRRRDLEAERFPGRGGLLDQLHALDLLELGHGLGGLGSDRAEPVGELLERTDLLLLVLVRGKLGVVVGLPLAEELGVVAGVGDDLALGDLVHLRDHLVHELAVVRNQQERARIVGEVVLQPEQGEQVEVVGGLVEQEQVGLHDEQPGEMGAHHPAAAEFLRGAMELVFAVAQPGQHLLGLGVHQRVGQRVVLGMRLHVGRAVHGAGGLEFLEDVLVAGDLAAAPGGEVEDGFLADRLALLGQVAHHRPGVALDGALVGLFLAENDGEKGGFAGAVGTDEGDTVAVVHRERRTLEEDASAVGHLEIADGKHAGPPGRPEDSGGARRPTRAPRAGK